MERQRSAALEVPVGAISGRKTVASLFFFRERNVRRAARCDSSLAMRTRKSRHHREAWIADLETALKSARGLRRETIAELIQAAKTFREHDRAFRKITALARSWGKTLETREVLETLRVINERARSRKALPAAAA